MKIDMSLKMNRPKRVHFALKPGPKSKLSGRVFCACGKDVYQNHYRANTTDILDQVSCQFCLDKLKEDNWYCSEHGFISDANVNFDETCSECGRDVVV